MFQTTNQPLELPMKMAKMVTSNMGHPAEEARARLLCSFSSLADVDGWPRIFPTWVDKKPVPHW